MQDKFKQNTSHNKIGMEQQWQDETLDTIAKYKLFQKKELDIGYYYTNIETFSAILDNGAIYSTNYRYLNDPNEWEYGYTLLIESLKEELESTYMPSDFKNFLENNVMNRTVDFLNDYPLFSPNGFCRNYSEIYTVSFTKQKDLISQWDRYAKESGVVLELDFSIFQTQPEEIFWGQISDNGNIHIMHNMSPNKIVYNKKKVKEMGKQILQIFKDKYISGKIIGNTSEEKLKYEYYMLLRYLSSYIKNKAYKQEKEIRISTYPIYDEATTCDYKNKADICYTVQNHVFVPHIPLYCIKIKGGEEKEFINQGLPIRSVRIGPGYNQEKVYQGVIHRLECGKKVISLPNEIEKAEIKIHHILKGMAWALDIDKSPNLDDSNKVLKKIIEKCREEDKKFKNVNLVVDILEKAIGSKDGIERAKRLQCLKQGCYEEIFREYEKRQYCTSDGILVLRSDVPYLFSK